MTNMPWLDSMARPLRDLRISVTDRCNMRCTYCMPKEVFGPDYVFLERKELLTYEEITRLSRLFVAAGVEKIRITGGEPLLRRQLPNLIARLAAIPGLDDLTLTTNGLLLARQADRLAEAGLRRVTVSLDSLDQAVFATMNGVAARVADVLAGIEAAQKAGLQPVKINCVVKRGVNHQSIVDLASRFRGTGCILRFIEYMDVGNSNGWRIEEVVSAREIVETIQAVFPIEPADPEYRGEVAKRWRYRDGGGEIGIITSVTQPFCSECTRARLSSEGQLFTCLFGSTGFDFRSLLRSGVSDERLSKALARVWQGRADRYSEIRTAATTAWPKVEMSRIGG